jgi:hypothetical protein
MVTLSVTGCIPTQSVGMISSHKSQVGYKAASLWLLIWVPR